jgi:transposase-like protein
MIDDDTMTSTFLAHPARKIRSFAVLAPAAAAWIQTRMALSLRKLEQWLRMRDFTQFHGCFHRGNEVRKPRG